MTSSTSLTEMSKQKPWTPPLRSLAFGQQHESLPCSDSVFSYNSASDPSAEFFVPYEDTVQLKRMSNFVEDSHRGASLTTKKQESSSIIMASHNQLQTCSLVSVLESSGLSTGAKSSAHGPETAAPGKCGRARSKHPRLDTFNHLTGVQPISPTTSVNDSDIPQLVPKTPSDS